MLTEESLAVDVAPELLGAGLGVAGAIGVVLLWVLDLRVYHPLLDANFAEAIRLEQQYGHLPAVPQTRSRKLAALPEGTVVPRVLWFYVGCAVAPLALAGGLLIAWGYPSGTAPLLALLTVVACGTPAAAIWWGSPREGPPAATREPAKTDARR